MSWYKPELNLNVRQVAYNKFLSTTFNMRSQTNQPISYDMTEYQKEFHSQSLNVLKTDAKDILFDKARGISFTMSSLVDLIMTGATFDHQTLPVIAHREKAALKHIDSAGWLIKNCNLQALKDDVKITKTALYFKSTGSSLEAFPSSSAADSVRSLRLIRGMIDEFAFQQNAEDLWNAIQECSQGDLSQFLIGSTPHGKNNKYNSLVEDAKVGRGEFKYFNLPVFDPKLFNPRMSILEQPKLVPIAPWISMKKLEVKRGRDWRVFMQENMTDPLDDHLSLIPYSKILGRTNEDLINFQDKMYTDFTYETNNMCTIGIDFAEYVDLFSIAVYEWIPTEKGFIKVQRFLDYFTGVETPELRRYTREVMRIFPTTIKMRIDCTGPGSGFATDMKREFSHIVERVHFAKSIKVYGKEKQGIKPFMCINLRDLFSENYGTDKEPDYPIQILNDSIQAAHISSLDLRLQINKEKAKTGHGDIFFANALALMPIHKTKMASSVSKPPTEPREMTIDERKNIVRKEETWGDKLKRYKKTGSHQSFY